MTVAQLMRMLADLKPDLPVLVDGYEGGYSDVMGVCYVHVVFDPAESYFGDYRDAEKGDERGVQKAIVLPRKIK